MGLIWLVQDKIHDNNCNENGDNLMYTKIHHSFISALFFGWVHIFLGSSVFCCSLFCSSFYDCEEVVCDDIATTGMENTADANNSNDMVAASFTSRKDEPLLANQQQQDQDLYSSIPIAEEVTAIPAVPYPDNTASTSNNNIDSSILHAVVVPCPETNDKHLV